MDRSDLYQDLALEPQTERTATARTIAPAQPEPVLPVEPPQAEASARLPLEPIPDRDSHERNEAMFGVSPRELGIAPPRSFIPETPLVYPVLPGAPLAAAPHPSQQLNSGGTAAPTLAIPEPPPVRKEEGWLARTRDAPPASGPAAALAFKAAKYAALAVACWMAAVVVAIGAYRFVDPPMSSLMLQRRLTGERYAHNWVPLAAISPALVRAVLVAEDGRFCQHGGIDMEAMQVAIEKAGNGTPRGASTISMQVTKNLFLWPSKSYLRKAIELPLTVLMEMLWPKSRVMEVYLNIAEWGPGVFGVEAAARHHFRKSAYRLTDREAAQLAVALPNPIRRDAGDPGPGTRRLASLIQARARMASAAQTSCVRVRK